MALYAHAVLEIPNDPEDSTQGVTKYQRGEIVPSDLPGSDELLESGAISEEEYDPIVDEVGPPATLEMDGVTYVIASEQHGEASNADAR